MTSPVSPLRLYGLRLLYAGNFLFVGTNAFASLLNPDRPLPQLTGVAFSFWAALGVLSGLGLRYPLRMLPVLFMQLFYKVTWLATIALPVWTSGQWETSAPSLFPMMLGGVVMDVVVIPWPYVVANFIRAPGDSWKLASRSAPSALPE